MRGVRPVKTSIAAFKNFLFFIIILLLLEIEFFGLSSASPNLGNFIYFISLYHLFCLLDLYFFENRFLFKKIVANLITSRGHPKIKSKIYGGYMRAFKKMSWNVAPLDETVQGIISKIQSKKNPIFVLNDFGLAKPVGNCKRSSG